MDWHSEMPLISGLTQPWHLSHLVWPHRQLTPDLSVFWMENRKLLPKDTDAHRIGTHTLIVTKALWELVKA